MKRLIKCADFVRYNANIRGSTVDDCVKRSISLAFDKPYREISQLLNEKMELTNQVSWMISSVFGSVIKDLGGSRHNPLPEPITVEQFVDEECDPYMTYILRTGETPRKETHLVCVKNGTIYDTFDCRKWFVLGYYTVTPSKPISNINDELAYLCEKYIDPVVEKEVESKMKKWDLNGEFNYSTQLRNYAIKITLSFKLDPTNVINYARYYDVPILLSFTPTTSTEEAIEYINKVLKTRIYDRLYSIVSKEKDAAQYAMLHGV